MKSMNTIQFTARTNLMAYGWQQLKRGEQRVKKYQFFVGNNSQRPINCEKLTHQFTDFSMKPVFLNENRIKKHHNSILYIVDKNLRIQ